MPNESKTSTVATLERAELPRLFAALQARGYQVVGPTVRDGAIAYDQLATPEQLPVGWTDEQDGGTYRLKKRKDAALFGYVVGPHSWKKYLFPPEGAALPRAPHRHRLDPREVPVPSRFFHYSTHAFSVAEAVELARALNQLPPRLILYGIEGHDFSAGEKLSPEIDAALDELVSRVRMDCAAL